MIAANTTIIRQIKTYQVKDPYREKNKNSLVGAPQIHTPSLSKGLQKITKLKNMRGFLCSWDILAPRTYLRMVYLLVARLEIIL